MSRLDDLLDEMYSDEKFLSKKSMQSKTYTDEPIIKRASAMKNYTPPKIAEMRALAEKQLLEAAEQMETELAVEAALAGKGYANALCVAREKTVTVMTGTALSAQDAALLLSLITEASGISRENIRMTGF